MVRLLCLENSSFNFWWSCCIRKTPQENTALSFCSCQCHVPELLVWGKKKHTSPLPRYISAFSQTISWPTSWCVIDWLLPAGGGSWPDCSRTQTPSVFTSLRITNVKSVNFSFYHRVGGQVNFLKFSLNSVSSQIPSFTGCRVLHSAVFICRLCSTVWIRNVRFSSL